VSTLAVARAAYREALPAIALSAVGGLLAGVVLSGARGQFGRVDGLLIVLPALLATRGNVYGTLGARVATGLHQGLIEPTLGGESDRLGVLIATALASGLLASAFAAVLATLATVALPGPQAPLTTLAAIAVLSGLLSGLVLGVLVVAVAVVGYRNGRDPDTLVGPVVTTAGDVFGVAFLVVAVRVVLAAEGG